MVMTLSAYAESFEFVVGDVNSSGMVITHTLTYDGSQVEVVCTLLMPASSHEEPMIEGHAASVGVNSDGIIVFCNSSGKPFCGVFSNESGTETYIYYKDNGQFAKVGGRASRANGAFASEFKRLKAYVGGGEAAAPGKQLRGGKRLPAKGDLTADVFATHPGGFMPEDCMDKDDVIKAIKDEGWPLHQNSFGDVGYRADLNFKVPFTLYGKPIWDYSISFNKGKISLYSIDTYGSSRTVPLATTKAFVDRMIKDLEKVGFTVVYKKVDEAGTYRAELKASDRKAEITTNKGGKIFFNIRMKSK